MYQNSHFQTILGKVVYRPAKLDQKLVREIFSLVDPTQDAYETVCGKTMCTNDFYEGKSNNLFISLLYEGLIVLYFVTFRYISLRTRTP